MSFLCFTESASFVAQTFLVDFLNSIFWCGEFHLAKIHNLVCTVDNYIYLRSIAIYWDVFTRHEYICVETPAMPNVCLSAAYTQK